MKYQFENEEIEACGDCPCCDSIIGCRLGELEESFDEIPVDCPLVAIPKTEKDGCEWCEDNWVYSDGYFGRYDTEEVRYLKLRAWHYCPNCGRKLRGETT